MNASMDVKFLRDTVLTSTIRIYIACYESSVRDIVVDGCKGAIGTANGLRFS